MVSREAVTQRTLIIMVDVGTAGFRGLRQPSRDINNGIRGVVEDMDSVACTLCWDAGIYR